MINERYIQPNGGGLYALMPVTSHELFGDRHDATHPTTVSESRETEIDARRLLSPRQVSELSGLHEEVVRRAIRAGELRASKLRGKLRVRLDDFDAWVDQNAISSGDWA